MKKETSNEIEPGQYLGIIQKAELLRSKIAKSGPLMSNDSVVLTAAERLVVQQAAQVRLQQLMEALLIDREHDHNSEDTPFRVAKMLVNETFVGRYTAPPKITSFPNVTQLDQVYVVGPIDVKSVCAHHWQPFIGSAWIGVMPETDGKLIGLSKFNRVVDHYARRGQIQEELTQQISDHLVTAIRPRGLAVLIKTQHFCMRCRGVNQDTSTITCVLQGEMRDSISVKQEFLTFVSMLPKG